MGIAVAVLVLTLIAAVIGGPARDIAPLPWAVLALLAAGDLVLSMRRRMPLEHKLPPEVFVGEDVALELRLPDAPPGLGLRIAWPEGLTGPDDVDFTGDAARVTCRATRRGTWAFTELWLHWVSRLKLFEFVPKLRFEAEIRVVPNIRLVQSGQITTTVVSTLFGVKENRAIGEGSEFHQLRDFVSGMDVKTIDWKRSARKRALVAKELRAERNHHVILAIDNGYLMREEIAGLPKIDHAVTAALATAWAAAIGGDLVGHYSYDVQPRAFAKPEPGRTAFARLRSWTAELDYVSRETNHTLALTELNARTPKRSLIIIFTDFVDSNSAELLIENIGILAKRHLLIFVAIRDPEVEALVEQAPDHMDGVATLVAANQTISERRLVLERLSRLGVTIVDAKPGQVTSRLISAYLEIKARELI
ncbi:putative conserved membrane protein [Candidatus Rhodobacter oscarellae]|uniref:Putative conserved membrane protein n=1 Tax=Candidatus Rhodobacter oscarellae TaxID=1675527 RepID=A0A0J9EEK0_9RHOB|nr:putative conserved membrane protein [Candidatus Rhodobacter lobularis]